jgi:hypothetical protein
MAAKSRAVAWLVVPTVLALLLVAIPPLGGAFTSTKDLSGLFLHETESGTALAFGPMAQGEPHVVTLDTTGEPAAAGAPAACVRTPSMGVVGQCSVTTLGAVLAPFVFSVNQTGTLQAWLSTGAATPVPVLGVAGKLRVTNQTGAVTDLFDFRSHRTSTSAEATIAPRSGTGNPASGTVVDLPIPARRKPPSFPATW